MTVSPILEIQKFLLAGGTLDQLREQYKLVITEHEDGRVMFNYNQIESPRDSLLCQEARGLILEKGTWNLVSLGLHRFFNIEEVPLAANIDFSGEHSVVAYDKMDGSYISMYWYKGSWRFSTRGSIDASGNVGNYPFTFSELIQRAKTPGIIEAKTGRIFSKDFTYVFELTSPYNRIVTPYENTKLTLIAARRISVDDGDCSLNYRIGEEMHTVWLEVVAGCLGVETAPHHNIAGSLDWVIQKLKEIKPTDEGFVVVEQVNSAHGFKRVKMKNPSYCALHNLKSENGVENLAVILQKGEDIEVGALLPDLQKILVTAREKMEELIVSLNQTYHLAKDEADKETEPRAKKKAFASVAVKARVPDFLFTRYSKPELSFREIIAQARPDKLAETIGLSAIKLDVFNTYQSETLPTPPTPG